MSIKVTLSAEGGNLSGKVQKVVEFDAAGDANVAAFLANHPDYSAPIEDPSAEGGYRDPTVDEMAERWILGTINGSLGNINRYVKQAAADAAAALAESVEDSVTITG